MQTITLAKITKWWICFMYIVWKKIYIAYIQQLLLYPRTKVRINCNTKMWNKGPPRQNKVAQNFKIYRFIINCTISHSFIRINVNSKRFLTSYAQMLICDPLYLLFEHQKTSNKKVFKIKVAQKFKIHTFIIYYNFIFVHPHKYLRRIHPTNNSDTVTSLLKKRFEYKHF